ncbi:hypothetical protein ACFSBZ_09930 [Amnibacterium flavum]|uniref:Uncharacterized protein n=1 Tax=Amnibacterium flavum TaxID=2173173 RepID=A0A2V1HRJ7_9MICO|nr:hypothetical protein [Amnibacterium flavum]PVZ95168.1 hypothetical protein DDQ50_01160 [Amnibacterium flavum]
MATMPGSTESEHNTDPEHDAESGHDSASQYAGSEDDGASEPAADRFGPVSASPPARGAGDLPITRPIDIIPVGEASVRRRRQDGHGRRTTYVPGSRLAVFLAIAVGLLGLALVLLVLLVFFLE